METTQTTNKINVGGILDGLIGSIFSTGEASTRSIPLPSESAIREKAYLLWEEAGRPESDGVEFWVRAEQELQSS
jgi:hypothetical protein